jgi:hypothetical protein
MQATESPLQPANMTCNIVCESESLLLQGNQKTKHVTLSLGSRTLLFAGSIINEKGCEGAVPSHGGPSRFFRVACAQFLRKSRDMFFLRKQSMAARAAGLQVSALDGAEVLHWLQLSAFEAALDLAFFLLVGHGSESLKPG